MQWTQEQQDKLVELYLDGVVIKEIAEAIGRTYPATRRYIENHRERLELPLRDPIACALKGQQDAKEARQFSRGPTFEQQWYGCVPRGHWSITKPWGSSCSKSQR